MLSHNTGGGGGCGCLQQAPLTITDFSAGIGAEDFRLFQLSQVANKESNRRHNIFWPHNKREWVGFGGQKMFGSPISLISAQAI